MASNTYITTTEKFWVSVKIFRLSLNLFILYVYAYPFLFMTHNMGRMNIEDRKKKFALICFLFTKA